jgi:YHS domain-containing protein
MKRTVIAVALLLILATTPAIFAQARKPSEKAKDPVCGIMVDRDPKLSANYKGETYYFCSRADLEKFKKEPEKYAKKK